MSRIKNIQFTYLIKAGGRLREFKFRRSQSVDDPVFTIDVADERGERHYVFFHLKDQHWILETKNLVGWVEEAMPQIQKAIDVFI